MERTFRPLDAHRLKQASCPLSVGKIAGRDAPHPKGRQDARSRAPADGDGTITPDLILLAERIHTPELSRATGVAVAAGRVLTIGSRQAILRLRTRRTRVLDLRARTLTPGLIDAHTHFFYWCLGREMVVDLSATRSLEEALTRIAAHARRHVFGEWVLGRGFDPNVWGGGFPTARDLDRAVADRPALIRSRDGHSAWLNTRGLLAAEIRRDTPDPPGGRYLRDAAGEPSGIVQESAIDKLPNPSVLFGQRRDAAALRSVDRALRAGYEEAWRLGIIGVHSMDDAPSLHHFQRHHAARCGQMSDAAPPLGVRVVHAVPLWNFERACELGLRSGLGDEWLRIGAVKIFSDGALGSQTAYMYDEYPGRPGYRGVPVVAGDALRETVSRAVERGWACWIHAIGDRAVHETVAALAAARRRGTPPLPHRIEHTQCIRPADVRRMAAAGIVASMQPCHILGDIATADRHWPRARRDAYPFRRLLDAGVELAMGSDVPVESLDPRRSFHGAVLRQDERHAPPGGWFPEERMTAAEVLRGFTVGAARSAGAGPLGGRIAVGALADFTIWEQDPLRVPASDLLHIGIAGCVVGGEVHAAVPD